MRTDVIRSVLGILCAVLCLACPVAVVGLSAAHCETGFDAGFDPWPVHAIDGLLWAAAGATAGLIWALRSWRRWVGAAVSVPLLGLTAVLAVTGGRWVEGAYF